MSREKAPEGDPLDVCVGEHGERVTFLAEEVRFLAEYVGDPAQCVTFLRERGDLLGEEADLLAEEADLLDLEGSFLAQCVTFLAEKTDLLARVCDKLADMTLGQTLLRVQNALKLNQKGLAKLMGCSSRTVIRYYKRGGFLLPATYAKLATACHPHDVALAAHLAQEAGTTLLALGLERPPPPDAEPAPASPRAPAPSAKHLVDSVVCAAAEAMQASPHAMRPALVAAFERVIALGMTAEEALKGMAAAP